MSFSTATIQVLIFVRCLHGTRAACSWGWLASALLDEVSRPGLCTHDHSHFLVIQSCETKDATSTLQARNVSLRTCVPYLENDQDGICPLSAILNFTPPSLVLCFIKEELLRLWGKMASETRHRANSTSGCLNP